MKPGTAFENVGGRLHPIVGFAGPGSIRANFGNDLENHPFRWVPGNTCDFDAVWFGSNTYNRRRHGFFAEGLTGMLNIETTDLECNFYAKTPYCNVSGRKILHGRCESWQVVAILNYLHIYLIQARYNINIRIPINMKAPLFQEPR